MLSKKLMLVALSSFSLVVMAHDEENTTVKKDPKKAELSYYATVKTEVAPEFGEVTFTYSVRCQKSAEAATKAISALSSKVWNTIVTRTGKTGTYTETERSSWAPISVFENEGSRRISTEPVIKDGAVFAKGHVKNIDLCTKKTIDLDITLPSTFSATQVLGIRTTQLDWLETLVSEARKEKQGTQVDSVTFNISPVRYEITQDTKTKTYNKLLAEAQERATGKGSQYESDKANLKFATAHFIGAKIANAPSYHPAVGSAITRGTPSKVELRVPFTYKIYAESPDRLKNTKDTDKVSNSYEIEGSANANADYAELSATVYSSCHTSKEDALKAIKSTSEKVQTVFEKLNNKENTEVNSLTYDIASTNQSRPSIPVEWNNDAKNLKVTAAYDPCNRSKVAVKEDGLTPVYFQATQTFHLRSSHFSAALDIKEGLVRTFYNNSTDSKRVLVQVSDLSAQITKATHDALIAKARAHATSCVLDPNGPVAKDAALHGFSCAHLSEFRMGRDRVVNSPFDRSEGFAAPNAKGRSLQSAEGAPAEDTFNISFEKRDNNTRPKASIVKSFEFKYRVLTENYVPKKSE